MKNNQNFKTIDGIVYKRCPQHKNFFPNESEWIPYNSKYFTITEKTKGWYCRKCKSKTAYIPHGNTLYSDSELLERLRTLDGKYNGKITNEIIDNEPDFPSRTSFKRFGGLNMALQLAGCQMSKITKNGNQIYKPQNSAANRCGFVLEDIAIMTEYLGRDLNSDEIIIHKDNNIYNNNIENLKIANRQDYLKQKQENKLKFKTIDGNVYRRCLKHKEYFPNEDEWMPYNTEYFTSAPQYCKRCLVKINAEKRLLSSECCYYCKEKLVDNADNIIDTTIDDIKFRGHAKCFPFYIANEKHKQGKLAQMTQKQLHLLNKEQTKEIVDKIHNEKILYDKHSNYFVSNEDIINYYDGLRD